jgi:hypothetical protein
VQINNSNFNCPAAVAFSLGGSIIDASSVQVSNCYFNGGSSAFQMLTAATTTGLTNIQLSNNVIETAANIAYNPIISVNANARVYITGNRVQDKGTTAATFINIAADGSNWVSGNMSPGWTNSFPSGGYGYYLNNLT